MTGAPAALAAVRLGYDAALNATYRSLKSTRRSTMPIGGIIMSFTSDVTIGPNAPPTITATAKSITFYYEGELPAHVSFCGDGGGEHTYELGRKFALTDPDEIRHAADRYPTEPPKTTKKSEG